MFFETPIKSPVIATFLRLSLIAWITLLSGLSASGQVKFYTVINSQEVGKSDYFQVEIIVENARQIDDLTPPDFHGFRIAQGPVQSSGMSVINGSVSQYKALSYVLEPTKTGKFTIGSAEATVDGKHLRSNVITVTVHEGGSGAANGGGSGSNGGGNSFGNPFMQPSWPDPFGREPGAVDKDYVLKPGENIKDKIKKGLFVKVQVDKNSCYVGEPIVATYKLYSRLDDEPRVTKRPSLSGFSVYDMVDPGSDPVGVEKVNGKEYTVHTIRKAQLIPLQSGSIDVDPMEIENTVHFVRASGHNDSRHSGNTLRDWLDQIADENSMGPELSENVTLDSKPVTINVKPLPEEKKPAGYSGAVGNFSVEATLATNSVASQDENTLHVVVKGKGNLPVIAPPVVVWPDGIQAFDPTSKEQVNKLVVPMAGSKSFDYVFTPRNPGHYTIPAVNFSYFDPATQTYKTAESRPLELQVSPAGRKEKQPARAAAIAPETSAAAGYIGTFIHDHLEWIFAGLLICGVAFYFLRQGLVLRKKAGSRQKQPPATTEKPTASRQTTFVDPTNAPQLPSMTTNAGQAIRQESPAETPDRSVPGMTSASYVPAAPVADPLQEAKAYFENGDSTAFYREINRALWKAVSRKVELPASELRKSNAVRNLRLRGWDETSVLSLEHVLNECEMNLYTPAYDRYNMEQLLRQTERLMERLR